MRRRSAAAPRQASQKTGPRKVDQVADLPDADRLALRARGMEVPVLFFTARDGKHDLLSGYAAGGDEYLSKPVHAGELLARLGALVRRGAPRRPPQTTGLVLDPPPTPSPGPVVSNR